MKRLLVFLCLLSTLGTGNAQNLILNGGFESSYWIPFWAGQHYLVDDWGNCSGFGSPDYFHTEALGDPGLPVNYVSTMMPYEGNAAMGLFLYESDSSVTNFREYIDQKLQEPLVVGQRYQLTFYVTNGTGPYNYGGYGCDQFSVAFSTIPLYQPYAENEWVIDFSPQYTYPGTLYTHEWQKITYEFVADSAYQYITFGSFVGDDVQQIQQFDKPLLSGGVNYYIDNINLESTTGMAELSAYNKEVHIFPNPVINNLSISFDAFPVSAIYLYTMQGELIHYEKGASGQNLFELSPDLAPGAYTVRLAGTVGESAVSVFIQQ